MNNQSKSGSDFSKDRNLFCENLPTRPLANTGVILVTGASGYIGGRLVFELRARGYQVRIMVRGESENYQELWPGVEVVVADALNPERLRIALKGIDTAYYLIHSLYLGPKEFEATDIKAAVNFRIAAEEMKIKRIIYIGGLGDIRTPLSRHLRNRMEVALELKMGLVPVTILRAGIIIGSGSASYEIIKHLAKKMPIILFPNWAKNRCQPIAIRDVIKYLVGVLEVPETTGMYYDIGGKDIYTYEEMLKILSELLNKRIYIISWPFSTVPFYAYLTSLFTPVPNTITQCLMEGLKNEVICLDNSIKKILPFEPISYKEAIMKAMTREEEDSVRTRWSDAYPPAHTLAIKLHELDNRTAYMATYSLKTPKGAQSLFQTICNVGGREGWFHNNWMWEIRGMVDRVLKGVGSLRGRKSYNRVEVNDVIEFWRIEVINRNKRLLLRAEMKNPGKAWLEFLINESGNMRELEVTAYYDTYSFWGKLYWYTSLPFHVLIFKKLIDDIEKRS